MSLGYLEFEVRRFDHYGKVLKIEFRNNLPGIRLLFPLALETLVLPCPREIHGDLGPHLNVCSPSGGRSQKKSNLWYLASVKSVFL